jgi:hypothetical protein
MALLKECEIFELCDYKHATPKGVRVMWWSRGYNHFTPKGVAAIWASRGYKHCTPKGVKSVLVGGSLVSLHELSGNHDRSCESGRGRGNPLLGGSVWRDFVPGVDWRC